MILYFKKSKMKLAVLVIAGETVISQLIRLGSNLVLTRILAPEMFGVMVIAMVLIIGINMVSDLGVREKYIQSDRSSDQCFIDTCWAIQIIRGFVIAFLVFVLGVILMLLQKKGYVIGSNTYSNKDLPIIIMILSVTAFIQGFNSIREYEFYKRIMVYEIAVIHIVSQLVGTLIMIVLALKYPVIWVLLVAPILSSLIKLPLTYRVGNIEMKNRFKIDMLSLKEIYKFGRWVFWGTLLSYALMNSDRIILGGLLTPEDMGVYSIALLFSMAAFELLSKVISKIIYPKLSDLVRDGSQIVKSMYSYKLKVDFVSYSLAGILLTCGSIIIEILYDERYYNAGWMFQILSLSLIFLSLNVTHYTLMALGKSYSHAVVNLISVVIVVIFMPIIYQKYGIELTIFFIALRKVFTMPLLLYIQKINGLFNFWYEFRAVPVFLISCMFGLALKSIFYSIYG